MRRLLEPCWWILFLKITSSVLHYVVCFPALTEGYVGALHENRHGSAVQIRRRKASGDPYWAYSGKSSCSNGDHTGQLTSHSTHLKAHFESLLCLSSVCSNLS
uniref:PTPRG protein n=1 Tax=Homo sapiens TaxID=9606 RepID=Q86TJ8_HUMAN|nr:PTPRG protein [Homo sapiens]